MPRKHAMPAAITRHGYWLAAAVPLLMPLGWLLRDTAALNPWNFPLWAWLTLPTLYAVLPLADLLIGPDRRDPDPSQRSAYTDVAVPVAAALAYLATLPWALATLAAQPQAFGAPALLGWTASLANLGGVVAINVAHELTHRRDRWLPKLGGLLLSCVWYPGFKLEHPRWHHVKVATPEDPSSAPLGASVYRQAPRAWWLNTACAWRLAVTDARRAGRRLPEIKNEMSAWFLVSIALTAGVYAWLGGLAAVVFVAHGIGAALLLEVINFVEHYGLRRRRREDGRWEPPQTCHSWDSDYWLSNALLLQLPRHADHHVHPTRPYAALQRQPGAPQLPFGYATAVVVALVPPLWRRVMDHRVPDSSRGAPGARDPLDPGASPA